MKKVYLLLFAITYSLLTATAQDNRLIDSLRMVLKTTKEDTNKVNVLNRLCENYSLTEDFENQIQYGNQAKVLAEKIGFRSGEAEAINNIGIAYMSKEEYPMAIAHFNQSMHIWEEFHNQKQVALLQNKLGFIAQQQGNFAEALKHRLAELKYYENINNPEQIAEITSTIGNIYNEMGNSDESIKRQEQAIAIYKQLGNKLGVARTSNNLGLVYDLKERYDEGLKYLNQALEIANEMGNPMGKAICMGSIANHYHRMKKYQEALDYNLKTLSLFEQMGNKFNAAASYINIGEIFTELKQNKKAREYLEKGLAISKQIGAKQWIANSYQSLSRLDSLDGNCTNSMKNYKLFLTYTDSITNEDNIRKSVQVQMNYDFDKKQTADSLKFVQEKEIAEVKLQKQKAITYGGFAGIAITIVLLFFVYRNYNKQRIANKQLKEAQEQLIKSEKMAAFGTVASRLSHEILNPLNFVNNFSEISKELVTEINTTENAEDRKEASELLTDNLQKINEHGKRAADIVKQLQEMSSKGTAGEFFEDDEHLKFVNKTE